ncbi:MAG TPA: SDR family NAD(P)-dependent oxidoreductase [Aldersonia sp.]
MDGQSVVVTGAASGIGRAIAELAAEQGWQVVVADRDEQTGEVVAAEITDSGATARLFGSIWPISTRCDP